MPSTYTTNGGIEKIATGEQSGSWGDTTNTNFDIIDRITNGVGSITLSGTSSNLQTSDGTLSDGQNKVLVLGGSPSGTHTITVLPNDAQKLYFVKNGSGQSVTFTQGSGGNVTIPDGESAVIYCDGAGTVAEVVNLSATFDLTTFLVASNNLSDVTDANTSRSNLGLAIGSDVQAYDAQLADIAGLTPTDTHGIVGDGSNYVSTSSSSTALLMPAGTTAQRPSGTNGMIRYNSDDAQFEGYADGAWGRIAGSGDTQTATTTTTTQTAIATYTTTAALGIEVTVLATDTVATERTITKLLITHDGTTAVATQYGEVNTATAMASYDVDISGGSVRLLATAASTNSTNFTAAASLIA